MSNQEKMKEICIHERNSSNCELYLIAENLFENDNFIKNFLIGAIRQIPSVEMNPQSQNDDQAYLAKIQHLSKYIEPLKKMIAKIGNEDQEKLGKMKKLMDILSNPTKRLDMKVLLRCESVLEHMIRDAPPDVAGHDSTSSSMNPLLDSVLKLKRLNSSQSMNHSMYRTFGPPLEAISGAEITLAPPVKRRKRAIADTETEENQLPDHIQGEACDKTIALQCLP